MTNSTKKSTTNIDKLILSLLDKSDIKSHKKYEYQDIIRKIFDALKPLNLDPLDIVNSLEPHIDFQTLTSDIAQQPLLIKITDLIKNIPHFESYGEFKGVKYKKLQRNINLSKNRIRLSFKAINDKLELSTSPIEFGRIYSESGKAYHEVEASALVKNSKFDKFKDLVIGFDLNYIGFQSFIKKMVILVLSGIEVSDEKKKEFYPYKAYMEKYDSQLKNLIPTEKTIYTNIRTYIYNQSILKGIDIACNIATNLYRKSGDLNQESFDVSEQKFGGLYVVDQYLNDSGIYTTLLESGLSLREISYICELITRTAIDEYRVKTLSIEDQSNYSISGLTSQSNTTAFAQKLENYDIYAKISQKLTEYFLNKAVESGEKINILFDSTIVFGDGVNISYIKKTFSNTKGYGKGIKAVCLLTESGIPLTFNLESGNTPDVTTLVGVVERLELFAKVPKEQLTIVCDAGYFSKDNILYLIAKGYDVNIVGKNIALTNEIIDSIDLSDRLNANHSVGKNSYVDKEIPLTKYISIKDMESFQQENPSINIDIYKLSQRTIKLVLIYNLDIYNEEYQKLQREIKKLKEAFYNSSKREKVHSHRYVREGLFNIVTDENNLSTLVENKVEINRKALRLGCNIIYSTLVKYNCEQIVQVYHSRINVEVAFKMCKQYLGLDAIRVHKNSSLQLKMLIIQLSIALKNHLYNVLFATEEVSEVSGVSKAEKQKLMDEYPNVFEIFKYMHNDLSITVTNGIVQYKNINKTSRIVLQLLGYETPEKTLFIQNSVAYKIKHRKK